MADRRSSDDHRHLGEAGDETRWTPVATAPDQLTAEMWQELMLQELIPAMLDPHDAISFMGLASMPVRLIVPAEFVDRAREVLVGVQGATDLREPEATRETDDTWGK